MYIGLGTVLLIILIVLLVFTSFSQERCQALPRRA